MDIRLWLKEIAILIAACDFSSGGVLESFRPKEGNPQELNEFLANVVRHKGEFSFIRNAARRYQKLSKDTGPSIDPLAQAASLYKDLNNYKFDRKRNIPFHKKRQQRRKIATHPKQKLHKRHTIEEIFVKPEAESGEVNVEGQKHPFVEKKQAIYVNNHRKQKMKKNQESPENFLYVDMNERQEKYHPAPAENLFYVDMNENRKGSKRQGNPHPLEETPRLSSKRQEVKGNFHPEFPKFDVNFRQPNEQDYVRRPSEAHLKQNPIPSDNVPFERPQIFEIEPRKQVQKVENTEEEFKVSDHSQPQDSVIVDRGSYFIDNGDTNFGQNEESPKILEKSGNDIKISDGLRDDQHFFGRNLKFTDEEMANVDDNVDEEFNEWPRARRDFLDALDMKNEDEYSEDNQHKNDLEVNNTDFNNDTVFHGGKNHSCRNETDEEKVTEEIHQKEDMKHIKDALAEETTTEGGEAHHKSCKGRRTTKGMRKKKKTRYARMEDFDDVIEVRKAREASGEKVSRSQDKIYNSRANEKRQEKTRDRRKLPKKLQRKVAKKQVDHTEISSIDANSSLEQVDLENEKLAEVANGQLASKIVTRVFDEVKKRPNLKSKFHSGLSRKHSDCSGSMDFNIFKSNESDGGVDEAKQLLDQITVVLNKLILAQVRRRLCQRLPDDFKEFLETIVSAKTLTEVSNNFAPNPDQGSFLFRIHDEQEQPKIDVKKLQEILVALEGLLLSYHNMNDECKTRAAPVKEFIEDNAEMARQMVACPTNNCNKGTDRKRKTGLFQKSLIEKQLESVGLGPKTEFIPNFDIDQIVRNKLKETKVNLKREAHEENNFKSEKFRKLQRAAEKIRTKRQSERRLGEMWGKRKRSIDYEEPVVYSVG